MLPQLATTLVGSNALSGLYNVGRAVDNKRFWDDYYKNTGFKPRYPYRSGYYDWVSDLSSSMMNVGFSYSMLKRF